MKTLLLAASIVLLPLSLAITPQQRLVQLANAGNGNIKLDAETFDVLLDPKRTWSASVHLTAMDKRRGCHPCRAFEPSWTAVAKSWRRVPNEQRDQHFFATLDFEDGSTIFQRLGLSSAPIVFNYPVGENSPSKYDFGMGFEAGPLAEFLSKRTPIPIPYTEPFDWSRYITIATGILSTLLAVRFLSPIIQSKWTWAAGTVIVSLVMISGFMFTRIRGVPYTGGNGNWIAQGYQNQFGQEVQVVSFIYGLLSFAFLVLIMIVPYQSSPHRQRIQVYLSWIVIMFVYSVLISIFRVKNRGYPFKLLF
jgi:oligosaccharyltransferase complex subunit gamma